MPKLGTLQQLTKNILDKNIESEKGASHHKSAF